MPMPNIVRRDFLGRAGAAVFGMAVAPAAWSAEPYPVRPIRCIVPFAPGGVGDVIARVVAQKLSDRFGKQFYVENIGGAGGNIGTGQAARAAPDGYTILSTAPAFVINPALYGTLPYDPEKDFDPVTLACTTPVVLTVNPSVPAQTVDALVAHIKANPGKYNYASAGIGTPPHLVGELFRQSLGLDLVHIPYNSGGAGRRLDDGGAYADGIRGARSGLGADQSGQTSRGGSGEQSTVASRARSADNGGIRLSGHRG